MRGVVAFVALLLSGLAAAAPSGAQMVPRHRPPDARFANLAGYPFAPHYVEINGLRMHYLDEGLGRLGTMLLLHGEPTWSFLYRKMIPPLTADGFRIIAPDMIGFGKSDKVTDESWYTLDAHVTMVRGLIDRLDLRSVTLVCHDWGGPVGLINVTNMPDRFVRLVILNSWLHHDGYEYTEALRAWSTRGPSAVDFSQLGTTPFSGSTDPPALVTAGYRAPFEGRETQSGARRWPWMLPFAHPVEGGAAAQARAFAALARWPKPAHVIFGDRDAMFTAEWGRRFAAHIPGATFDIVPGAGHMVQEVGVPLVALILKRVAEEP